MSDKPTPNVLFIMADQMKASILKMYSEIGIDAPGLERLAAEGVRFEHAITPHPLCVPARTSMMTGRYPHSTGCRRNETLMPENLQIINHPLVQHKLTLMRKKDTSTQSFRTLIREVGTLLAYEVTKDLPVIFEEIETPLMKMNAPYLEGKKLCLVSILRAGNGLLDGFMDLVPSARVGHIGLYRDPKTLAAVEYYMKLPDLINQRLVLALDPMLATGHSSTAAVTRLKENGASNIRFVCLLAVPEGIEYFSKTHPDVPIYTAAVDEKLNDHAYILPGLGDAGDRIFGTK